MLFAILALSLLAAGAGLLLAWSARRYPLQGEPLAEAIDALLPQTQCTRCGYPGCRPYAQAVARNEADINLCAPGGAVTVVRIATLLGRENKAPASPERPGPAPVAFIAEDECIGCALCLKACPVDAIIGAPRFMHTVIASLCTGCELCIPPCPVDCISLRGRTATLDQWQWPPPALQQ